VSDVIAFLVLDGTRWITGANIPIDGGPKVRAGLKNDPARVGEIALLP
jgi:hypothetical protein